MRTKFSFHSLFTLTMFVVTLYACGTEEPFATGPVPDYRQNENIYYIPSATYSPLSSEKNHLDLNLLHSSGSQFTGYELQAGYMVSDKVGVTGGLTASKTPNGGWQSMNFYRYEFGAGYVVPMKKGWHYETYGGVGKANVENEFVTGYSEMGMTNFFVQPGLAYNNPARTFSMGFMSRFSGVNFHIKNMFIDKEREELTDDRVNDIAENPFHIMWEPGIVLRAGGRGFKLHAGYSHSADLSGSPVYRSSNKLTLGLNLHFNTTKKK